MDGTWDRKGRTMRCCEPRRGVAVGLGALRGRRRGVVRLPYAMSAAAVIAIRRKRMVKRFREAGATDPEHAVTPESLGERRTWIFDQMVEHGVFLPTQDGRFFMDDRAGVEFLRQRRRRALLIGGVLVLVFLLLWAFGLLGP